MSKIVKTMAIALAVTAVLAVVLTGSVFAGAASGTGPGDCADCQELQCRAGMEKNDYGHGEPGDGAGPDLHRMHRYGIME